MLRSQSSLMIATHTLSQSKHSRYPSSKTQMTETLTGTQRIVRESDLFKSRIWLTKGVKVTSGQWTRRNKMSTSSCQGLETSLSKSSSDTLSDHTIDWFKTKNRRTLETLTKICTSLASQSKAREGLYHLRDCSKSKRASLSLTRESAAQWPILRVHHRPWPHKGSLTRGSFPWQRCPTWSNFRDLSSLCLLSSKSNHCARSKSFSIWKNLSWWRKLLTMRDTSSRTNSRITIRAPCKPVRAG